MTLFRSFAAPASAPAPALALIMILALLLFPACPAPAQGPSAPPPEHVLDRPFYGQALTLLHTSDVHSRLLPVDRSGRLCTDPEAAHDCLGGTARVAGVAAEAKQRLPNDTVLLLDAGDVFQGSTFFSLYKGRAAARVMNAAGYDAMTLGNHEFDEGPGVLGSFLGKAGFPVLACNVDATASPALAGQVFPWVVLDMGGTPVGVIGALTPETAWLSKGGGSAVFKPVAPAVARCVSELEARGVQVVILLSHQGITPDLALARSVDGIDVIVSGHSHVILANDGPNAFGPYPMVVDTPSGAPCLVVATGEWGTRMGRLSVRFDESGTVRSWSGRSLVLDNSVPEDPAVQAVVQELAQALEPFKATITTRTAQAVSFEGCRSRECAMGDLLAEALLQAGQSTGARVGLINAGAIRSGLPQGDVTLSDLLTALPFGGDVVTTTISGADLMAVLEHGLSRAGGETEGTGRFLQVAGVRLAWDPAREAGQRLVRAEVKDADGNWGPVDPGGRYVVATNGYMASGGDDYRVLAKRAATRYHTGVTVAQALRRYLADRWPLTVTLDCRITQE